MSNFSPETSAKEVDAYWLNVVHEMNNGYWNLIYPGKEDWEYRDQPFVHIREFIAEKDAEIELHRNRLSIIREETERLIEDVDELPSWDIYKRLKALIDLSDFKPTKDYVMNYVRDRVIKKRNDDTKKE